jgi:hypothetical protein
MCLSIVSFLSIVAKTAPSLRKLVILLKKQVITIAARHIQKDNAQFWGFYFIVSLH